MAGLVGRVRRPVFDDRVEDGAFAAVILLIALHAVTEAQVSTGAGVIHALESVVVSLAVFLRRTRLQTAIALVIGATAVDALVTDPIRNDGVLYAVLVLSYTFGAQDGRRRARFWLVVFLINSAFVISRLPDVTAADFIFEVVAFGVAFGLGALFRARELRAIRLARLSAQVETERANASAHAVSAAREQIAREVQAVVARNVGKIMTSTTAVNKRLEPMQVRERMALVAIGQAGAEALAEMNRLVRLLGRGHAEPDAHDPGLDDLDVLIERVEHAGLRVELSIEGARRALPAELESTAFRIIQEGLTNTLKHAGAASVRLSLTYAPDVLSIDLADDGTGGEGKVASGGAGGGGSAETGGFGLAGMRERAALHHGTVVAGGGEGTGFTVHARLPIAVVAGLSSKAAGPNQT